jgi:CelD/BcsL family acetyltransferase involved in cellulose biosynthesis
MGAIASVWRHLEARAQPNPFVTFDWMDAWWRAFGDGHEPYVILVEDDEGTTVGIAPLFRSLERARTGGTVATLRFIGDPGSDRLGFVSDRGQEREVAAAVATFLRQQTRDWHVLQFGNLDADSVDLRTLEKGFAHGHLVIREPGLVSPYLTIRGDWETFLQGRSANFRAEVRRNRKRLEHKLDAQIRSCSGQTEVRRALEFLFRHSIERFEGGQGSSFANPRFREFHLDVASRLYATGRLSCYVLEIEGAIAAAHYDFVLGNVMWYYNASFDQRWSSFKPGSVLLARVIENAFERGYQEFDFLLGDHPYKRRWTEEARQNARLAVIRPGPHAIAAGAFPPYWSQLKRWLKHFLPVPAARRHDSVPRRHVRSAQPRKGARIPVIDGHDRHA